MATLFEHKVKIREKHLDTFGHVNNATYLELYEEARWEMLVGEGWTIERIQQEKIGPVILDIHIEFKKEIRNREEILIQTQYKEKKSKYVSTFYQEMINEEGKVASTITLSFGLMDLELRKLIEPSGEWMKAMGAPQ